MAAGILSVCRSGSDAATTKLCLRELVRFARYVGSMTCPDSRLARSSPLMLLPGSMSACTVPTSNVPAPDSAAVAAPSHGPASVDQLPASDSAIPVVVSPFPAQSPADLADMTSGTRTPHPPPTAASISTPNSVVQPLTVLSTTSAARQGDTTARKRRRGGSQTTASRGAPPAAPPADIATPHFPQPERAATIAAVLAGTGLRFSRPTVQTPPTRQRREGLATVTLTAARSVAESRALASASVSPAGCRAAATPSAAAVPPAPDAATAAAAAAASPLIAVPTPIASSVVDHTNRYETQYLRWMEQVMYGAFITSLEAKSGIIRVCLFRLAMKRSEIVTLARVSKNPYVALALLLAPNSRLMKPAA